jgi:hypothetical protein
MVLNINFRLEAAHLKRERNRLNPVQAVVLGWSAVSVPVVPVVPVVPGRRKRLPASRLQRKRKVKHAKPSCLSSAVPASKSLRRRKRRHA